MIERRLNRLPQEWPGPDLPLRGDLVIERYLNRYEWRDLIHRLPLHRMRPGLEETLRAGNAPLDVTEHGYHVRYTTTPASASKTQGGKIAAAARAAADRARNTPTDGGGPKPA